MRVAVGVIILVLCVCSSCRDRVVCPAYQSTYILDDSVRQTYYSYLWKLDEKERQNFLAKEKAKDSIPNSFSRTPSAEYFAYVEEYVVPERELRKNQYGIIKYEPWWIKTASLRTAPKVNVHKPVFEEEEFTEEGTFLAGDFAVLDSLGNPGDSVEVKIPMALQRDSLKNKGTQYLYDYRPDDDFNMEQIYYNKYFGEYLVDRAGMARRDSLAKRQANTIPDSLDTSENKKKGFFKNLFKKKNKNPSDSTAVDPMLLEEDPEDTSEETTEEEGGN
ncbi:MAG: hypothetical protein WBA74_03350 [Cyclobacteriaceae bacterium]